MDSSEVDDEMPLLVEDDGSDDEDDAVRQGSSFSAVSVRCSVLVSPCFLLQNAGWDMDLAKALFQSTLTAPHNNTKNVMLRCNGGAAPHQTGEGSKGQNNQRQRSRDGDVLGSDLPQVLSCVSVLAAVAAAFLTWWPPVSYTHLTLPTILLV